MTMATVAKRVHVRILLCLAILAGCSASPAPRLELDPSVAPDFAELANETFDQFVTAFPAHEDCIDTVVLAAAPVLDDRAADDLVEATMTVRVPGSADRLREAMVHELAHHLEARCSEHEVLRPAFMDAAGFPANSPWFQGATWEQTPSEVFAEATVEYVLGGRVGRQHLTTIPTEAIAAVASWAGTE